MSTIESDPVDLAEKNLRESTPFEPTPFDVGEAPSDRGQQSKIELDSVSELSVAPISELESGRVDWWARLIAWLPKRSSRQRVREIEHVAIKRNDLWASDWDVRVEDSNCLEIGLKPRGTRPVEKTASRWWWRRRR